MFHKSLAAVLLLAAAVQAAQIPLSPDRAAVTSDSWQWEDCGSSSDVISIESIEVSPDPPEPGKDMTVKAKGVAKEQIEWGATADVTVKLGYIQLLKKTFDICDEAKKANASIQCPIEEDEHTVEQTVALPKEIPKAKFDVHVEGYTKDDDPMMCLDLTIDFRKNSVLPW